TGFPRDRRWAMDEILARSGIFQGVEHESAEALAKEMETIDARKGEVIFSEGEPGDSLYIVLTGKIKIGRRAADGRQNLIAGMGPSDMLGELSLFDPGPPTATPPPTPPPPPPSPPPASPASASRLCDRGSPTARRSPSNCCASSPAACAAPTTLWPT